MTNKSFISVSSSGRCLGIIFWKFLFTSAACFVMVIRTAYRSTGGGCTNDPTVWQPSLGVLALCIIAAAFLAVTFPVKSRKTLYVIQGGVVALIAWATLIDGRPASSSHSPGGFHCAYSTITPLGELYPLESRVLLVLVLVFLVLAIITLLVMSFRYAKRLFSDRRTKSHT